MAKRYRLRQRYDDGTATFTATDAEGSELLTVKPDGSKFFHRILGVDLGRAWGLTTAPAPVVVTAPVAELESVDPVPEPTSRSREPMVDPPSEPAPDPAHEKLERDAKRLGKSVWLSGGGRKHTLLQGIPVQEDLLDYAVSQGWVKVSEDGVVTPGPTRPVDLMPVAEPLSAYERRVRWGPTQGGD